MVSIITVVLTSLLFGGLLAYMFLNKRFDDLFLLAFLYMSAFIWGMSVIFCGIRGF